MSFIKIDREILDSYCFANPNHLKVWLWLLIKANYKDGFVSLKMGKGFTTVGIKRGQLLFGRFKAEEELGLDGSLIYRALKKFEELEQINIESNNLYSIVTICKYDSYQGYDINDEQPMNNERTTNEQQVNNKRTTSEQQVNTSKEELEEIRIYKNIKEIDKIDFFWEGAEIVELWNSWKEYKLSHFKFKYKTIKSEQVAFDSLLELSTKNLEIAKEIIKNSMANGWKGLFLPHKSQNKALSPQNGNKYQNELEMARMAFKTLEHDNSI